MTQEKLPSIHPEPNPALAAAAFGQNPGLQPLPTAQTSVEHWLRAVALAGQGHYAEAAAHTGPLRDPRHGPPLRSMALSLDASMLRQQGEHRRAMELDVLAMSYLPKPGESSDPDLLLARCDALTGLAADAIGLGQLDLTRQVLARLPIIIDRAAQAPLGWRARLRWHWVTAEAAMAGGDGSGLLKAALEGERLAMSTPSLRHRVKSRLVLAAAHACVSTAADVQRLAHQVLDEAEAAGLWPLAWAGAMLLHSLVPDQGWDTRAQALRGRWT